MNQSFGEFLAWAISLAFCVVAVMLAFSYADVPIAIYFEGFARHVNVFSKGLGSAIILSIEAVVVTLLVIFRLIRGKLPRFAEALALACLTSICAYGINAGVLKLYFGVPNPFDVMHGSKHIFNWFDGSPDNSFPSGHMVLATAFAGVFIYLYRASIWPLSLLLMFAGLLLIAGDWHFLSDVIAGTFIGATAGFLAGKLWEVHSK